MINVRTKKNSKKQRAGILLASAVKWAEIAADPENGRNSKKLTGDINQKFQKYQEVQKF